MSSCPARQGIESGLKFSWPIERMTLPEASANREAEALFGKPSIRNRPSAPAFAVVSTPAPKQAAIAAAPAPATPLGVWATEENKGNVRIELCGQNLCGYAENSGEQILINMKPSDNKWVGRIHDPDSGSNYDSTIAMKSPNTLKVQGCAFGGMFCGGQTWKRIS